MDDKHIFETEPEKLPTKTRVMNKIVIAALILAAIGVAQILLWAFERENVLVVNNDPFPTRTIREHPVAGGVVIMDVDYCKNKDIDGKLRMSFINDARETLLPVTDESGAAGCHKREVPILIPKDLPPGTYIVRFEATYKLNPLKTDVQTSFESQEFTIE